MARLPFQKATRRLLAFSKYAAGLTGASFTGLYIWTRNCHFVPFHPDQDPLFRHPLLKQTNPRNNPVSSDSCVREIPFAHIKPSLLENAKQGGTGLIEAFAAGIWGGYGYAIQRNLMRLTKDDSNREDVWSKQDLLASRYDPGNEHRVFPHPGEELTRNQGTFFTNHFLVLEKSPISLTLRGCFSPRQSPPAPQTVDNLAELAVTLDEEKRVATFRFKCITFDGTEDASQEPDPFGGVAGWLHRVYAKLLLESGTDNCVR